jgi:hypothetical protein
MAGADIVLGAPPRPCVSRRAHRHVRTGGQFCEVVDSVAGALPTQQWRSPARWNLRIWVSGLGASLHGGRARGWSRSAARRDVCAAQSPALAGWPGEGETVVVLRLDGCGGWPVRRVASARARVQGCHHLAVTDCYPVAGRAGVPWTGSWTGCCAHWVRSVLSVHFLVQSVQLVRSGRRAVPMVRRRSTVRFRKGALIIAAQMQLFE